ncbi:hypothetical protein [Kitasatospora herbaricolor]|uniref:hypothetical protein n=1 Tax=Kitasatospora herbaricolor TaxID=68217 RepID=UPI0036D90540
MIADHMRTDLVTDGLNIAAEPEAATAAAYHQRWEEEAANGQLKAVLVGPRKVLRSQEPGPCPPP